MGFYVHLYFHRGEALRKDVEILICIDAITENAKNQVALGWLGINFSLIKYLVSLGYFKKPSLWISQLPQSELGQKQRLVELSSGSAATMPSTPPFSVFLCCQWWADFCPKLCSRSRYCERPLNVASLPVLVKHRTHRKYGRNIENTSDAVA